MLGEAGRRLVADATLRHRGFAGLTPGWVPVRNLATAHQLQGERMQERHAARKS
jgi:hypothetical protein